MRIFWLCVAIGGVWPPLAAVAQGSAEPAASSAASASGEQVTEASAPASVAEQPALALYASREARDMALLAQATPADQVVWLTEGDDRVLALYQAAITSEPVGAVLLVQDQDLNARWPERIQRMRLALPEHGWTTLVVALPPPDPVAVPVRDPVSVEAPAATSGDVPPADASAEVRPETQEVFDDQTGTVASVDAMNQPVAAAPQVAEQPRQAATEIVDQRLAQAIRYLHDQGQLNLVLLAEGAGAVRAARLAQTMSHQGFQALVLVDAHNQLAGENGDVVKMITELKIPVLDVFQSADVRAAGDMQLRRVAAKRAGLTDYQALDLPVYEPGQQRQIKRVRGFLEKYAKGVKVENAQVLRSDD